MKQFARIVFILSATIFVFGCSKTPEEKIASLRDQFMEKLAKFDYQGAQDAVGEMSKIEPGSPYVISGNGMIFEQHLWTIDAFDAYGTLMNLAPKSPEGYLGAYRIQKRFQSFDDALVTADELGKVDPKNPQAISLLAEAILQSGMPQLANRIIDSAQSLGLPEGEVGFLRARAKFLSGNVDSARVYASSALAKKSSTPRYYELAADYYEAIGHADSAIVFSKMEMDASRKLPLVWIHHFDRTLRLGYFASARETQREIIQAGADSGVILGMQADYYNAANRFVEASNASIYLATYSGPNIITRSLHELRARSGMKDGLQVTDLLGAVSNPIDNVPMSDAARLYLASYLYLTFAPEADPISGLSYVEQLFGPTLGRKEFKATWLTMMYITGEFRRFDSLKAIYEPQYSSLSDWQMYMGDMYDKGGFSHFEEARERYENSLRINDHYLPAFEHYLKMLENQSRYPEALALFERFPHFAALSPALSLRQAAILVMLGKRQEAMQMFEGAITKRSGDMRAITRFLDALAQRYDEEGKTQALTILARIAPENPDIITLLVEDAINKKNYVKGKELAEKGIRIDPDQIVLYALVGRAQFGLGESDKALEVIDSLYPVNQHDPDFVYQYSRLLAENGINLDKAANLARGSVMYSNYRIREYMNLIDVYYQMGRYDLSWNESANISVSFPTRPEAFYRLGRAGVRLGKPDNKKMLEKSIALGLGGDELVDAKKLLSELP